MKKVLLILSFLVINTYAQDAKKEYKLKGVKINNGASNFSTSYYGDDYVVFSSSEGGNINLYKGKVTKEGISSKILFFDHKTSTHESNVIFTNDLKTVYFTRSLFGKENTVKVRKNQKPRIGIFRAEITPSGKWVNVFSLPFNNKSYDVAHPALNKANNKLYFVSNMPGSMGDNDIFVVDILGGDEFSKPQNLGNKINTKGKEMFPYVTANNELFYSSTGFKNNLGGLDIYRVDLNGDLTPEHLKSPINSKWDDFSYIFNENRNIGFLTSNRPSGKGSDDIYVISKVDVEEPVIEETNTCVQKLKGTVYINATQKIIPFAVVKLVDAKTDEVIKTYRTNESAKFSFETNCNSSYKLIATAKSFETAEKKMKTNGQNSVTAFKNIFLISSKETDPTKRKIVTGKVDFEFNKANLLKRFSYQLDKAIILLKSNPILTIDIESHTDGRAAKEFNMQLTEDRINVIKEYIAYKDISVRRITAKAYGDTKPLNKCIRLEDECSEELYMVNRRTTFKLIEKPNLKY